jgi:predicted acyl esterase
MSLRMRSLVLATTLVAVGAATVPPARAQGRRGPLTPEQRQERWDLERQLASLAVIDRKVMVRMRDGARMAADIYRPKDTTRTYPTIFVRTPYNFNFWDVRNGAPRAMTTELDAIRHGYAYVEINERGHFFSEGDYDILGPPLSDGHDEIEWIASRPWSNGKVGLIGCSSTAEWQSAVASTAPKGLTTMIPESFGAGVGRVGPYYEQGNWYRGGAVQMLFIDWLYGEQNQARPMFPPGTSQADLIAASRLFDLAPEMPPVDWMDAFTHLPEKGIIRAVDGPRGIFADTMPGIATGGAMIERTPNDPAWYQGGLWHDDMKINIPALYFMTWYDVSIGPNLAEFNRVRQTADSAAAAQQYVIIAPTLHCAYKRATENTIVGERSMGDARYDYDALTWAWFDHFLKGADNGLLDTLPHVRYYTMGRNEWQTAPTWPPPGATPMTFYLASNGNANTLNGDGVLQPKRPSRDQPDTFTYDPMNPVPSHGGNVCCQPGLQGGAMDQREMEQRPDVLVYTSEPLKEGIEVSGPVDFTTYVSSDRKDTDVTVKLIDVYPDGRAYNLDETIQRLRYRDGYDQPLAWLEPGKVYRVSVQPMNTSNYFPAGHRVRIEVSSSNFPRFDRNLNTGGNNYDETSGLVAHNTIHHSAKYPSALTLTVVRRPGR